MGEEEGECPVRLKKDVKEPALLPKKPDLHRHQQPCSYAQPPCLALHGPCHSLTDPASSLSLLRMTPVYLHIVTWSCHRRVTSHAIPCTCAVQQLHRHLGSWKLLTSLA